MIFKEGAGCASKAQALARSRVSFGHVDRVCSSASTMPWRCSRWCGRSKSGALCRAVVTASNSSSQASSIATGRTRCSLMTPAARHKRSTGLPRDIQHSRHGAVVISNACGWWHRRRKTCLGLTRSLPCAVCNQPSPARQTTALNEVRAATTSRPHGLPRNPHETVPSSVVPSKRKAQNSVGQSFSGPSFFFEGSKAAARRVAISRRFCHGTHGQSLPG